MWEGIIREPSLSNGEITCLVCSETPGQLNPVNLVGTLINKLSHARFTSLCCARLSDTACPQSPGVTQSDLFFFLLYINIVNKS